MQNKKVLFITFDMSGYYTAMHEELQRRYSDVDYFNTAQVKFKYKNIFQKIHAFFYKLKTGQKLKNFYKYQQVIDAVEGKSYDIILMIRPDLFFDSQLGILKRSTKHFVAYYHDSVNNIKRKKDVIHFFDKVYAYEKKDVADYNLEFIPNFIYFDAPQENTEAQYDGFSVMSNDYRVPVLRKVAENFKKLGHSYKFFVMDDKPQSDGLLTFITKRMNNAEVVSEIKKADIIVDIHKFGIQDGLTFRTFEAMGFRKKMITTNKDIRNYDFFNPDNIFVIDDVKNFEIPESFFEKPYTEIPPAIYEKYTVKAWLDKVLTF